MGSDFYKRTKELFEEFQKRELHYLNTESIYSDQFHVTSDINLPVEEYLQKLNKREKESEDTYRGLMAHMEELDRRTESISAKLEKLDSLRSSMFLRFPSWSSSNNNFEQQYPTLSQTSNILQANQDFEYLNAFRTNQDYKFRSISQVSQMKDIKSAATQTDHMFCENCQFPIAFSSGVSNVSCPLSSAPESSISLLQNAGLSSSSKADSTRILNPSADFVNQNTFLKADTFQAISQPNEVVVSRVSCPLSAAPESSISLLQNTGLSPSIKADSSLVLNTPTDIVHQNTYSNIITSQIISQPNEVVPESMLTPKKEDDLKLNPRIAEIPTLSTKETEIDSHTFYKNDSNASIHAGEKINVEAVAVSKTVNVMTDGNNLVSVRKQSIEDNISISDSVDKVISKSDDESLNHEFDFLDSDKRSQRRVLQTKQDPLPQATKNVVNNLTNTQEALKNDQLTNQIDKDNLLQSNEKLTKKPIHNVKSTYEVDDKQSESSISIGGANSPSLHSENLSAISDSDSLYEKEDPHIKTSAAYQTLLGNVPIAKTVQQLPYSESESEDEIEKALANTTKKNRKISLNTTTQEEKKEDSKKSVPESKPKMEPRKSISGGKSQQLSKNTRKVLGLDTSSGSEGEVKIEANIQKKIEEDSDEFDFYD